MLPAGRATNHADAPKLSGEQWPRSNTPEPGSISRGYSRGGRARREIVPIDIVGQACAASQASVSSAARGCRRTTEASPTSTNNEGASSRHVPQSMQRVSTNQSPAALSGWRRSTLAIGVNRIGGRPASSEGGGLRLVGGRRVLAARPHICPEPDEAADADHPDQRGRHGAEAGLLTELAGDA